MASGNCLKACGAIDSSKTTEEGAVMSPCSAGSAPYAGVPIGGFGLLFYL